MNPFVNVKITGFREPFLADVTNIRLLFSVSPHVNFEDTKSCEAVSASFEGTMEVPFLVMGCFNVVLQVPIG